MPVPQMKVDRRSSDPLWIQITRQLERALDSATLRPGEMLPTEIELARRLDVSRPTMRRALNSLVEKGILIRRPGVEPGSPARPCVGGWH